MKLKKIPKGLRHSYVMKCSCCEAEQKILTQEDKDPEYHTKIYLECTCGEFIKFVLPVN